MKRFLTLFLLLCSSAVVVAQQNTLMPINIDDHWTNLNANGILVSANTNRSAAPTAGIEVNTFNSSGALVGLPFYYSVAGSEMQVRDMSEAPAVQPTASSPNGVPAGYYITGALHAAGTTLAAGVASKMFVMRVTAGGAVVWARVRFNPTTASTRTDVGVSVVTMPDGEVIAVGNSNFTANNFVTTNIIVGRFGVSGGQPWAGEYACSCVAGGVTPENPLTAACNLVAREATLDQTGGLATTTAASTQAAPIAQQGIAITGYYKKANTATGALNRTFVMLVNGLGTEMWRNSYPTQGTNTTDEGWDIIQNPNKNYEFAIAGQQGATGSRSVYFATISAAGAAMCQNIMNTGATPTTDIYARAINMNTTQSGYVLAGPDNATGNTFFLETSPTCGGVPIWMQEYPLTANHATAAESIQRATNTLNNGYFVSTHALGANSNYDPHVLMTDNMGVTPNCANTPKGIVTQITQGFNPLIKCQQVTDFLVQAVSSVAITVPENPCPVINPNPCPNPNFFASLSATNITVCAGNSFTATATAAGGTAPYTYNWAPINPASPTLIDVPLVTTTYTVTITDANGCTATASLTVIVIPLPVISIAGSTTVCYGSTTTLTASGGVNCVWSTGTIGFVETVGAGIYTVTITDANGCNNTQSITVTGTCCLAPTLIATPINCNTFQLTTGGFGSGCTAAATYTYNFGDGSPIVTTAGSAIAHTYTVAGVYTACVTVTQVCNNIPCTATVCVSITVAAAPTVTIAASTMVICPNRCTTLTATGTPAGGTYAWGGGTTSASGSVTYCGGGTYTVTYTDANGCTATASITITVAPAPTVTIAASKTTLCPGECSVLTPTSTPTGGTYAWSSGAATTAGINTVCVAGVYTVTYTSTAGCTATASITITASTNCCNNFTITDMKYYVYSYSRQVTFQTPTVTGCTGTLSYFWEFGDGTTSTLAAPIRTYLTSGIKTACVTVTCTTNGQVCQYKCCRTINIGDPCSLLNPIFSFSAMAASFNYTFNGTANTGTTTQTWDVFNSAGPLIATGPNANSFAYVFPAAGEYTVCRTVATVANATSGNYCSVKHCRKITVVASTGCNTITPRFYAYLRNATPLVVVFTQNAIGATNYEWAYASTPTGPFTLIGNLSTFSYTFPSMGTYWVRLVINSGTPCEKTIIHRIELTAPVCAPYNGVFPPPNGSRPTDAVQELTSESTLVQTYDEKAPPVVMPNPTNGILNVMLNKFSNNELTISILNLQGTLLATQRVYSGTASTEFDLSAYPSGMYMVTMLTATGERVTHKVVKE